LVKAMGRSADGRIMSALWSSLAARLRVILPVALCLLAGALTWKAGTLLQQLPDSEVAGTLGWVTWALGGLSLPAAALLILGGGRREDDGGRARRADRRLQALVQNSSDMIIVLDRQGTIAIQTGAAVLGHAPGELQRRPLRRFVHEDDHKQLDELLAGQRGGTTIEWRLKHVDGHWLHLESAVADMRDDADIQGIVLTSRDVTERKASEAQLRHRAFHDPLTQLPNRSLFYDRIEHALHRGAREGHLVAVCILDLDDFKKVNDSLGHAAGDELLVSVAQRLRGCLRTGDTAARLGGDEFGILIEGVGERSEAIQVADRLLSAMRQQFEVANERLDVLPSVGLAIGEGQEVLVEDLLRHADVAMYAAKNNGKGRYEVYDPSLAVAVAEDEAKAPKGRPGEDASPERMTWFRRAEEQRAEVLSLLDREGSIKAQFQPLLDLRTARIAGFEALSRFGAPSGDRPPNVWFSQAHRAGLGPRLEAAALRMALSAPGRPTAAFLSLNVSPSTLTSDEVRGALPDDLTNVVIEITENELVTAAPSLHGTLEELRSRGAKIAVDDAGAGYAGFTQLLRLRPDIIKLDRELVHGVAGDEYRAALVSSFVRFGRSIDSLICAEGIETLADLRTLADLDVTYGQGYALAPPGRPWPEVDESAVAACYSAWQAALRGRSHGRSSEEGGLERVAARIAEVRGPDEVPAALDEAIRDLGAERGALRRAMADGTLVTVGGVPLTAGARIDANRPEFATADGRLLVLQVESAGQVLGVFEVLAPEGRPWHRSEIHRARVIAQLFATVLSGSPAMRLAAAA
jgi:diguanylate cyclase (GGDEF)-like protein/PAS domain S-box-containing protein